MSYAKSMQALNELRRQITELRQQMREIQTAVEPQAVEDYEFSTPDGGIRLSQLFGEHDSLILIHNMGAACVYCTLWADGFNGVSKHLENRAAFVVSSPDTPDEQRKFAESRGWQFRMVSHHGTSFAQDMGYTGDHGFEPGISVFKKRGAQIVRVSDASLGPGDDFCSVWHMLDMLPEGADGWQPRYDYGS